MAALKLLLGILLSISLSDVSLAGEPVAGELELTLAKQIQCLEKLKMYVDQRDLGRVIVLERAVDQVITTLKEAGRVHTRTFLSLQNLIITFRYSNSFLSQIDMIAVHEEIESLRSGVESIAADFGFDEQPYTKITLNVYSQVHKLLLQLLELQVSAQLKAKLRILIPKIGALMAQAESGDRPRTYAAARPVNEELKKVAQDYFRAISTEQKAFAVAVEIDGLNEYYSEVAQNFEGIK